MTLKALLQVIVVLFMMIVTAASARADGPMERIKETTDKIIAILSDPDLKGPDKVEEKRERLRQVVDERFDWEEFSRRTLAKHWRKRTEKEKREFVPLFGMLIERTYMDKVEDYSGEKVRYDDEKVKGKYGLVKAGSLRMAIILSVVSFIRSIGPSACAEAAIANIVKRTTITCNRPFDVIHPSG